MKDDDCDTVEGADCVKGFHMVFSPGFQSRPDGREANTNLPNTRNEAFEHAATLHILYPCRLIVAANHVSQNLLASSNTFYGSSRKKKREHF